MFRPRSLLAVAAAVIATACSAAPASADVGFSDCDDPASSQVFSPWLDYASYFLAPDGGFENGADGWSLNGDASVGAGNESYNLSGPGTRSLALGVGDSAVSPAVCVGLEHPTFRFVARRSGGLTASVAVSVVLENGLSIPVGTAAASSSWSPSALQLVVANLLPTVTGGSSTQVRFQFTPVTGSMQIDDVYVDPGFNH
jgi:hypothetical protein